MSKYTERQAEIRTHFILERLDQHGALRRRDLCDHFGFSTQTATTVLNDFRRQHPDVITYDASQKAFLPGPNFEAWHSVKDAEAPHVAAADFE